jgi:hypothetical protein
MSFAAELVFLPSYSSEQTHPLDIGIFDVHKVEPSSMQVSSGVYALRANMLKMLDRLHKATTRYNVVLAFPGAEICLRYSEEHKACLTYVDRQAGPEGAHLDPK